MSDVSEQAKALAADLYPAVRTPIASAKIAAQRAIDAGWVQRDTLIAELDAQGWTPPPDPWEVIARRLSIAEGSGGIWQPDNSGAQRRLVGAVRDLLTEDEARAIAGRIEGDDRG